MRRRAARDTPPFPARRSMPDIPRLRRRPTRRIGTFSRWKNSSGSSDPVARRRKLGAGHRREEVSSEAFRVMASIEVDQLLRERIDDLSTRLLMGDLGREAAGSGMEQFLAALAEIGERAREVGYDE